MVANQAPNFHKPLKHTVGPNRLSPLSNKKNVSKDPFFNDTVMHKRYSRATESDLFLPDTNPRLNLNCFIFHTSNRE